MAYSELIKNYQCIRNYVRHFYVYGFKNREEYRDKSARSYDDERRRVESWLGEYMFFRQSSRGKTVFLSVDSRSILHNPLYKSFKAKSFTAKDITLHFYILDLLSRGKEMTNREMMDHISLDYLSHFDAGFSLDSSTLRKKLKEYETLGLLEVRRQGRDAYYRLSEDKVRLSSWQDAAAFFSEAAPLGVIGSFLLDKFRSVPPYFGFKHHYILHALDSQILCELLTLIQERKSAALTVQSPRSGKVSRQMVFPLKIYISSQSGRQYLLSYFYLARHLTFHRLDGIQAVSPGVYDPDCGRYAGYYEKFRRHLWGVSTGPGRQTSRVEMTVRIGPGEDYILRRLERERRCGTVERTGETTWRFQAEVYDPSELLPWLRTFTGRIVSLTCSDQTVVDTFRADLAQMREMYGGGGHAFQ